MKIAKKEILGGYGIFVFFLLLFCRDTLAVTLEEAQKKESIASPPVSAPMLPGSAEIDIPGDKAIKAPAAGSADQADSQNILPPPALLAPAVLPVPPEKNLDADLKELSKFKERIEPSFKIAGSLSRRFQAYSGITGGSEILTDLILHHTLQRIFGGKIKVKVRTYSFTDLWHLKVKKAKISLTGSHYKDIPLGKVEVESVTPFWFGLKHRHLQVKNLSLFKFKMTVSEKEFDQLLHSPKATNSLKALRLDLTSIGPGMGEQKIQMQEPQVNIDNQAIMLKAKFATPGADPSTAVFMTIYGEPKLHGDNLVFLENIKIDSPDISEPEKFSKFVENLINPLIRLSRFDKTNFALRLDDISIKSKSLSVSGRIVVGPHAPNNSAPGCGKLSR